MYAHIDIISPNSLMFPNAVNCGDIVCTASLIASDIAMLAITFAAFVATVTASIPYVPAEQGWSTVPFAGTGESTLYGTNFGDCEGTVSVGIPVCTGFQLQISFQNGTAIGTTPVLTPSAPCPSNFADPHTPPTPTEWIAYSFPVLAKGATVLNFQTLNGEAGTYLGLAFNASSTCLSATCTGGSSQFVYVPTDMTFGNAEAACSIRGLQLASMSNANFLDGTSTLFNCGGAYSQAWVHDWYGNSYEGTPLTLDAGAAPLGGAITVPAAATQTAAMCQRLVAGQYVYYLQ